MPHFLVLTHIYTQLAQKPVKHVTASWQRVFDRPSMLTSSICEGKERENKNGNVFCVLCAYKIHKRETYGNLQLHEYTGSMFIKTLL